MEDKLQAVRVALRPFTLNLNTEELHKNRETPSAFHCYLGVMDVSLPGKGVAHRKVRGTPETESGTNEFPVLTFNWGFFCPYKKVHFPIKYLVFYVFAFFPIPHLCNFSKNFLHFSKNQSFRFCSSSLWLRQSLQPSQFPSALNEKDFVVPGTGAESLLSNDQRRNLTDHQETAQWCGGVMVPKNLLTALFSGGLF